jgi:ATP-dependent Lhr-like helicase
MISRSLKLIASSKFASGICMGKVDKLNKAHHATDGLSNWFARRGLTPWSFQARAWDAYARGESGLIHVPTGSGKTLAAFGGPLRELKAKSGLQILYISPLRAVIRDVEKAVGEVVAQLEPSAILETKTSDTSAKIRARQSRRLPDILFTTPESLSLMLTRSDLLEQTKNLHSVILDEWHELMGTKRGLQVELALSHLLPKVPNARVWAMSGTLANLEEAAKAAVGLARAPVIISETMKREVEVQTIVPKDPLEIPWAGHLGMKMLPEVLSALNPDVSTLIFTNTRSQSERWYQAILNERPEMAGLMALHHSAMDPKVRLFVEDAIKTGEIKWVVCTSSLDLGVDFGLVEKVVQIGSAKGVARLIQRAGRANHRPNESSLLAFVPTQAMEVAEVVAIKHAVLHHEVERRTPFQGAIDVLEQHLATCACGEPIDPKQIYAEIKKTVSYETLASGTFDWIVEHLISGGALHHYPQFKKLIWDEEHPGKLKIASPQIARFHKLGIGTIVSDATISVVMSNRKKIGQVEESYITRMKKGDRFLFAGRVLEFILVKDMKAYVRPGKGKVTQTPRWMGGKLPISEAVCAELREVLHRASSGNYDGMDAPEKSVLEPLFTVQKQISVLPKNTEILIECTRSREGAHLFLFPFEGRLVHEGMAALFAYRLSQLNKATFGLSVNDYGIELLAEDPDFPFVEVVTEHWDQVLAQKNSLQDLSQSIHKGEYSRRHFREIARVAGLLFQGYPSAHKNVKQMQVSSSLLYDVLSEHEPENLLIAQAHRDVLERQFESTRMLECMRRLRTLSPHFIETKRFSPLAFPLVFERLAATVSSETLLERLDRMKRSWVSDAPQATRDRAPRIISP